MKQILINIATLVCFLLLSQDFYASQITPYKYYICGDLKPQVIYYNSLRNVFFYFSEHVSVLKDAKAYLLCEGKIFAESDIQTVDDGENGIAKIPFPVSVILPKGKSYTIRIPAGSFYSKGNEENVMDEISVNFRVPDKITDYNSMLDNGDNEDGSPHCYPLVSEDKFCFYYPTEIENATADVKMYLYREGKLIMSFPVTSNNDYNIGTAWAHFGRYLNFEKNVHYTFLLPEGFVRATHHNEIFNVESRCDNLGEYDNTFRPILHSALRIPSASLTSLGTVLIDYDTPVQLAPEAKLQLVDAGGSVLKEAVATLSDDGGVYTVEADFGSYALDTQRDYSVCIPEATVVGTSSDITVNQRTLVPLSTATLSVDNLKACEPKVEKRGSTLYVNGVERGSHIAVFNANGILIASATSNATTFSISLPQADLLIVKAAGKVFKLK